MTRSTQELLHEALVHLDLAAAYADNEILDQLIIDAICMRLSAGIEVLGRINPPARAPSVTGSW